MPSPQTLSVEDRRIVAAWAADCAERVLHLFEAAVPGDLRPADLIARARAFADGEIAVAVGIRDRFVGGVPANEVRDPAAMAAARAAGQASAVVHMGAHALGAAGYAAKAVGLADPGRDDAVREEVRRQLDLTTPEVRSALRRLPRVGENPSGPLGPGLLSSGAVGRAIGDLQTALGEVDLPPRTTGV